MSEVVWFTEDDIVEMAGMALDRRDAYRGRPHVHRMRERGAGEIEAYIDGWRGEWAVADSLRVDRPKGEPGRPDDGYDVIAPNGETLNVRYANHPLGRLMALEAKPIVADVAVLVVPTRDPLAVRIVGAVNSRYLMRRGHVRNFGHGETRWLAQEELVEWERWKSRLRTRAA